MNLLLNFLGVILVLLAGVSCRQLLKKPRNKVHFYVARDECGSIYLYLGKPERRSSCFFGFCGTCATLMVNEHYFKDFGLNPDDFKDLKWEDEPVEVFLNLDD